MSVFIYLFIAEYLFLLTTEESLEAVRNKIPKQLVENMYSKGMKYWPSPNL